VLLDDPELQRSLNGLLLMQPATADRYFSGVERQPQSGFLTAPNVPLDMVLRAVAGLRGDPRIAPPDTGSAGLAAGRT
jgi:hypothetical protein